MQAHDLAHGVLDKRKRGRPARRASDRKTLDEDDERPSPNKIKKVTILAIVTCNFACPTHTSSGGVAAKTLPLIQDTCHGCSDGEEAQG